MKNRKKILKHILIFGLCLSPVLWMNSCEWTQLDEVQISENDTVSFANEIIPIFNNSCNMGGCHPANGISPDLSPENAYFNLDLLQMIDTVAPEESVLYKRMISTSDPMPPAGVLDYDSKLILNWIKQGALDN